jgi:hypothetical protein
MQRFRQSRLFTRFGAVVVTLVILAAVAVAESAVRAPIASATPTCSVQSLKGEYLGNLSGVSSSGPQALQVRDTYNGDGTGTASVTIMTQTSGPTSSTATFTYTLKSDCTGTFTSVRSTGTTAHYNIVVVDNATQVDFLRTDPGFVVTGTTQKK